MYKDEKPHLKTQIRRGVFTWRPNTLSASKIVERAREIMLAYAEATSEDKEEGFKLLLGKVFQSKAHTARERDEWRPRRSA